MTDGRALLEAHLNGEPLSDAQRATLSAWVCASPDHARLTAELTHLSETIALNIKAQSFGSLMDSSETGLFQEAIDQGEQSHASDQDELPPIHIPAKDTLTKQQYVAALTYVIEHTFTPKRLITGGIAAALLLGAVLAIVLMTDSDPQDQIAQETPNPPALIDEGLDAKPVVATLTASHNAQWAEGALAPGSHLTANQRLTLTAGFAEITTSRGAIAILEAPATVEFSDNDNALRLHTGKLVGICETESSKGLLVRTPHMDITDIGTRFGVDATQSDATEVHVFEGEVQATRSSTEPVLLAAAQSARAAADTRTIIAIDHAPDRFAAIRDESGLSHPSSTTAVDTDTDGIQWLVTTSQFAGTATYLGNLVTCTVDHTGFSRGVVGGNAYGFIQHGVAGAGVGEPATATGAWTFSNLPAGRYDVATAFNPIGGGNPVRYTVNGAEVLVDQSALPPADAGPTFASNLKAGYRHTGEILFTTIKSLVVVSEGGSITVAIDNANLAPAGQANMDSIAITRVPETGQN